MRLQDAGGQVDSLNTALQVAEVRSLLIIVDAPLCSRILTRVTRHSSLLIAAPHGTDGVQGRGHEARGAPHRRISRDGGRGVTTARRRGQAPRSRGPRPGTATLPHTIPCPVPRTTRAEGAHRDPWSLSHADTAAQALAERRERMAAELAMQATNERIKAARAGRAEAEQGMNNAREMERDLRQQLANLEVEFSEQSGQVAALLERLRRQEDLTTAGECTGERAQGV